MPIMHREKKIGSPGPSSHKSSTQHAPYVTSAKTITAKFTLRELPDNVRDRIRADQ